MRWGGRGPAVGDGPLRVLNLCSVDLRPTGLRPFRHQDCPWEIGRVNTLNEDAPEPLRRLPSRRGYDCQRTCDSRVAARCKDNGLPCLSRYLSGGTIIGNSTSQLTGLCRRCIKCSHVTHHASGIRLLGGPPSPSTQAYNCNKMKQIYSNDIQLTWFNGTGEFSAT